MCDYPSATGEMNHLLTLKLDMNRLLDLPDTLGGLSSLTELFLFENMIDVRSHCIGGHSVTGLQACLVTAVIVCLHMCNDHGIL